MRDSAEDRRSEQEENRGLSGVPTIIPISHGHFLYFETKTPPCGDVFDGKQSTYLGILGGSSHPQCRGIGEFECKHSSKSLKKWYRFYSTYLLYYTPLKNLSIFTLPCFRARTNCGCRILCLYISINISLWSAVF